MQADSHLAVQEDEPALASWLGRHRTALCVGVLIAASALPMWAAWRQHGAFLSDDTYITLTYAKNLLAGNGFVYNHPPATFGTTTPLLTLVLAFLGRLLPWFDLQTIAVFFTAACWAGVAWVIFLFRRAFGLLDWQALVVGLAVLAAGWPVYLGMEAYLFALLLILSLALYLRGDRFLCGLAAGLLILTRGEGVLFLGILLAIDTAGLLLSRERPLRERLLRPAMVAAGVAVPVVPWALYARITFGGFLPSSLPVKMLQGQLGYIPTFSSQLFTKWLATFGAPLALPAGDWLSIWWILVATGLVYAAVHKRGWLILVAWIAAYIAAYTVMGVADYGWYRLPVLFVLQITAALGLVAAMGLAARACRWRWLKPVLPICLVLPYLLILGNRTVSPLLNPVNDFRGPAYTEISGWLNSNTDAGETVAINEVGYLGYFTDAGIVDLSGLVSPEAIPALQRNDLSWTFWHDDPDYLVCMEHYGGVYKEITSDPRFAARYAAVASFASPWKNERDLVIYKRR